MLNQTNGRREGMKEIQEILKRDMKENVKGKMGRK